MPTTTGRLCSAKVRRLGVGRHVDYTIAIRDGEEAVECRLVEILRLPYDE